MSVFKEYYLWFKKRFFVLRLTILLLILFMPVSEFVIYPHASGNYHYSVIQELVWIACEAIRAGSEPSYTTSVLTFYRAQDTAEFSRKLTGQPEKLTEAERAQLALKPSKRNQIVIYDAAHRLEVPGAEKKYGEYRRELFMKALAQTDADLGPKWSEVHTELDSRKGIEKGTVEAVLRQMIFSVNCIFYNARILFPVFVLTALISYLACIRPGKWCFTAVLAVVPLLVTVASWETFSNVSYYVVLFMGQSDMHLILAGYFIFMLSAALLGMTWRKIGYAVNTVLIWTGSVLLAMIPFLIFYNMLFWSLVPAWYRAFSGRSIVDFYACPSIWLMLSGLPIAIAGLYLRNRNRMLAVISRLTTSHLP